MAERLCPDCGAELAGRQKRDPLCALARQREQARRWREALKLAEIAAEIRAADRAHREALAHALERL